MCTTYCFLHCKLPASFSAFAISFFHVKLVNNCEFHVIFQNIEPQLQENVTSYQYRSNLTFVFFKALCHANPGVERKSAGSSSYISRQIF